MYLSEAEILDKEMNESWKEGMNGIVIFVSFGIPSHLIFPTLGVCVELSFFSYSRNVHHGKLRVIILGLGRCDQGIVHTYTSSTFQRDVPPECRHSERRAIPAHCICYQDQRDVVA
jgi:hypothetical protein